MSCVLMCRTYWRRRLSCVLMCRPPVQLLPPARPGPWANTWEYVSAQWAGVAAVAKPGWGGSYDSLPAARPGPRGCVTWSNTIRRVSERRSRRQISVDTSSSRASVSLSLITIITTAAARRGIKSGSRCRLPRTTGAAERRPQCFASLRHQRQRGRRRLAYAVWLPTCWRSASGTGAALWRTSASARSPPTGSWISSARAPTPPSTAASRC
uniref:Secreted protein n=1 Tax=Macrostomum lignano TaxID=282301 RepID=A0A1I8FLU4_9PLAT